MLRRCGHLLHVALEVLAGVILLLAVLVGGVAWRLSRGPLELDWLSRRLEQAAVTDGHGTRLVIGRAALVWEGWNRGIDQPLDLRLTDLRAETAAGLMIAAIPSAAVSLSPGWLLLGRIAPRSIAIEGANLRVQRGMDGGVSLDLGNLPAEMAQMGGASPDAAASGAPGEPSLSPREAPAAPPSPGPTANLGGGSSAGQPTDAARTSSDNPFDAVLTELARPPQNDRSLSDPHDIRFAQLRRVLIRDAHLTIVDRQLDATWQAPSAEIDLHRDTRGGVAGTAEIALALGESQARLSVVASLTAGGTATQLEASLSPVTPATLARGLPALSSLRNLDAPMTLQASAAFGPHQALRAWALHAVLGQGHAHIGTSDVPLLQGQVQLTGDGLALGNGNVRLVLPGSGHDPVLQAHAELARAADRVKLKLTAMVDKVAMADLSSLWPAGLDHGARDWVVANLPAGVAHDVHAEGELEGGADFSNLALTSLSGGGQADDVTLFWLRPVPALEHVQATLSLDGPDSLTISASSGQTGALQLRGGTLRISGLAGDDQAAVIQGNLAGPIADTIALLRHPRLRLLDRHPIDLRNPGGVGTVRLGVTLPLKNNVTIDQVAITATANLTDAHVEGLVAGRDLDRGELALQVDNDGLALHGTAELAHIPVALQANMDFRTGPASQVVQSAHVSGHATDSQLAAAGLNPLGLISGPLDITAGWQQRRNGAAELRAHADLVAATLTATPTGWSKQPGRPASLDVHLLLDGDHLVSIDQLHAAGEGLAIDAHAQTINGRPSLLVIDRADVGASSLTGTVALAARPGGPIRVSLAGSQLDLSARLTHDSDPGSSSQAPATASDHAEANGPPWMVDARFDRVLMAKGLKLTGLTASAESDGRRLTSGHLAATGGAPFGLELVQGAGGRLLTGQTSDAGSLLRMLDLVNDMQGGRMNLSARSDDRLLESPLTGTAQIDEFRMRDAPALARLLQAMSLYGLVEVMRGPGLGFTRLVAPFRLQGDSLDLIDARAWSPSLGLTAKGHFDLARSTVQAEGTIVPAYFFNSLLGGLPLIGKLFSPEQGGGVFAATYRVTGALDAPTVTVNPLAALTPGFLRGLFKGF
jgi:hypothetical protein